MESYVWLLLSLVALTAGANSVEVTAQTNTHTLYVQNGENLHLGKIHERRTEVAGCQLTDNNGNQFVLYPEPEDDGYDRFLSDTYKCKTSIYKMTDKDAGIWKMNMTLNKTNGIEEKISVYNVKIRKIYEQKSVQTVNVYPNQQVSIRFHEKFNNLDSCRLLSPEQIEYNLDSDKMSDMKKSGRCGAKVLIKPNYDGKWTLIADLQNNTAYAVAYNIVLKDGKDLGPSRINLTLKRGEEATISGERIKNIRICIIEDPHGVKQPMHTGPCNYRIQSVNEHHEGIWNIYYGLEGYLNLIKQEVFVQTYSVNVLNSSVTRSANGDINLLCQVQDRNLRFCSFVRPDGEILHMTYGVGNDKYEYYGEGLHIDEVYRGVQNYDCGITIHKPSNKDYGSWRCLLQFQPSKLLGRVLKVTPPKGQKVIIKSNTTAKDVYVKRGDSYKVKCVANEVLNYCWLSSPNGTVHSVQQLSGKEGAQLPALDYDGAGLELGECGAEIKVATESDDGQWTCHMGIADGPELEANFKVILKDTYITVPQDIITPKSNGDTDLICQPLPGSSHVIESCRWINPHGYGIGASIKGRYFTETKSTHCKLSIRNLDVNMDIGKWTCYARFEQGNKDEFSAQLSVMNHQNMMFSSLGNFLGLGLLLGLGFGICLLLFNKFRFSSKNTDEEIILEKPNSFP